VYDRRIAKRIDDGAGSVHKEHYIYDLPTGADDKILLRFVEDDGVARLTNRYLHGPAVDQILADEQYDVTDDPYEVEGDVLWALTDNLGSVRDLVSYDAQEESTVLRNHITYDAFGRTIAETVPGTSMIYTYTGREYDAETGNYYYRARYYDPDTGRFLSEDPIAFDAGDPNLARYVGNDPVNRTDPSGLEDRISTGAVVKLNGDVTLTGLWYLNPGWGLFGEPDERVFVGWWDRDVDIVYRLKPNGHLIRGRNRVNQVTALERQSIGVRPYAAVEDEITTWWGATTDDWDGFFEGHSTLRWSGQERIKIELALANKKNPGVAANINKEDPSDRSRKIYETQESIKSEANALVYSYPLEVIANVKVGRGVLSGRAETILEGGKLGRGAAKAAQTGPGQWTRVVESMSVRAAHYQSRITGRLPDVGYVANGVKFDGFDDVAGVLLDAKGPGYSTFVRNGRFQPWYRGANQLVGQARRQVGAANGTPIRWHVAEQEAADAMRSLLQRNGIQGIDVVHTP
jgi:RHS repeat-associated protein